MKTIRIFVTGRVQGVFFRAYTRNFAVNLKNLTGYVRNLYDGRVEIYAEGSDLSLQKLLKWAKTTGSPASRIESVVEEWSEIHNRTYTSFLIEKTS